LKNVPSILIPVGLIGCDHRNIRLIEGNARRPHLKKLACKRDFAAGVYLPQAQNTITPLLHTVYVYTVYLYTQGRGRGGELNQREWEKIPT
jgi:hypothetical protein